MVLKSDFLKIQFIFRALQQPPDIFMMPNNDQRRQYDHGHQMPYIARIKQHYGQYHQQSANNRIDGNNPGQDNAYNANDKTDH